jgi:hypothetical protein
MNTALTPEQRATELVSAMSIDQKIAMLSQAQPVWAHYGAAGYIPGQPSLCIPDLVLNDAGQGVGDQETGTTAFPAPIAQSSSWDPSLQYQFGAALGWEAWHKATSVRIALRRERRGVRRAEVFLGRRRVGQARGRRLHSVRVRLGEGFPSAFRLHFVLRLRGGRTVSYRRRIRGGGLPGRARLGRPSGIPAAQKKVRRYRRAMARDQVTDLVATPISSIRP